jgi:hypothetical protein
MKAEPFFNNFTGGEISERFAGRVDTPDYLRTVRTMENLIIHPSGGVDRRPGTVYCGEAKIPNGNVRLIPFVASAGQAYILELTGSLLRIWQDGSLVQDGGSPLEITTPWDAGYLYELKYAQSGNAMYFVHPEYQVRKLLLGEGAWTLTEAFTSSYWAASHCAIAGTHVMFYGQEGDVCAKLPDPDTMPGAGPQDECRWSRSGLYWAQPEYDDGGGPFHIYKQVDGEFQHLSNPLDTNPTGNVLDVSWSPGDKYLAVTDPSADIVRIYERSGDSFTQVTTIDTSAIGGGYHVSYSPDGNYLACGGDDGNYLEIYSVSGTTYTKEEDPATLPPNTVLDICWSPDSLHLVVGHLDSPYMTIYRKLTGSFVKLLDPATLPSGPCRAVGYAPNNTYLAVGGGGPFLYIYKRVGATYTKLADPATLPDDSPYYLNSLGWSSDSVYLGTDGWATYGVGWYKRSGDTFTKLSNPDVYPGDNNAVSAFHASPNEWHNIPWDEDTYPAAIAFHEQRLILARGLTVWGSRSGDPQDFMQDASDASAGFAYTFASDLIGESIRWMVTKQHNIILGTTMGEWLMTGGNAPISNSNVYVERASAFGSANIQGIAANESILYAQKGAQILREFLYSEERGGYLSPNLTYLADHIGKEGFVEFAWQRTPRPVLWAVRSNGELAALTYDRNHGIQAWHRHPFTDGQVISVAVIPGSTEDVVYLVVKRVIDGTNTQYVEYIKPLDWGDDQRDCFLVDSGQTTDLTYDYSTYITGATKAEPVVVTAPSHPFQNDDIIRIWDVEGMTELNNKAYMVKNKALNTFELYETDGTTPVDGTGYSTYESGGIYAKATRTITGLAHLEGEKLDVFADGAWVDISDEPGDTSYTVSSGEITIKDYASLIHVGLGYTPKLQPQRLRELPTHYKRIDHVTLRLYKSLGGKVGQDANSLDDITYKSGNPPPFFTGDKEVPFRGGYNKDGNILITQPYCLPLSILALFIDADITEI